MQDTWALVLAAGSGTRLEVLTTNARGEAVPKQFCSLRGGPSLLDCALQRARTISQPARVCAIVADQHRQWWKDAMAELPARNVIVQPQNRGTAIGVLWSLLEILERDPDATLLMLPSDHHVCDEAVLAHSLRECVREARSGTGAAVLLGMQPDEADAELGYVVPRHRPGEDSTIPQRAAREAAGPCDVDHFAEKPALLYAQQLIRAGALWNTFIIAARARELLQLFKARWSQVVLQMQAFRWQMATGEASAVALNDLYDRLPNLDFSRDILVGQQARLRVLRAPACGWSDLGTPRRVTETLRRLRPLTRAREVIAGRLDLAMQCERLHITASI